MRRKNGPAGTLDRQAVLCVLAERLDNATLQELFPDHRPDSVRRLLRDGDAVIEADRQAEAGPVADRKSLRCSLYTDGASRGNPGEAGAGIVLYDELDRELTTRALYLGRCTNNVAEYRALIAGLETAAELGCRELAISMDSELIVRQIQGRYKVKNAALKPLFARVRELLAGLDHWEIRHVPRADNKRADELANRGIDQEKR